MTDEKRARMIERVRRLLALSTSSNEHEAAAAAAKAQELLEKYKLDKADISDPDEHDEEYVRERMRFASPAKWRGSLLGGISRANNAYVVMHGRGGWTVVGQPSSIEFVQYLYQHLSTTLERLADEAHKAHPWEHGKSFKNSFYWGAVGVISNRLQSQRREFGSSEAGRALVVREDKALQEAIVRFFPRLGRAGATQISSSAGYSAGRTAGESVNLNRPLSSRGSSGRKLLA